MCAIGPAFLRTPRKKEYLYLLSKQATQAFSSHRADSQRSGNSLKHLFHFLESIVDITVDVGLVIRVETITCEAVDNRCEHGAEDQFQKGRRVHCDGERSGMQERQSTEGRCLPETVSLPAGCDSLPVVISDCFFAVSDRRATTLS